MKVSEYIRRKNDIIEKATGIVLVPEDQIIDLEPMSLSIYDDYYACPYCMAFKRCDGCPMFLADNGCDSLGWSTYCQVYDILGGRIVANPSIHEDIKNLVKEYNESNGF